MEKVEGEEEECMRRNNGAETQKYKAYELIK